MSGCAACVEGLCIVYQAANVVQPIDELPELLEGVLRCGHGFASGHLDCLLVDLAKPVHCPGYVVVFSVRPAGKPLLVLHEDDGVSMRQAATLPGGLRGRGSSSMLRLPVAVMAGLPPSLPPLDALSKPLPLYPLLAAEALLSIVDCTMPPPPRTKPRPAFAKPPRV
eukprot:CAMPEP_0180623066 /NCGR_PEP_ID=MMETSP1037_2-20121125/36026_1 /TAXON_ID=632150 /ORGANISM="Azadinium spinosum, Strain 3D9" /LENGTH=166 /DNA_ID=CAMNT_0022643369 /DNA_START=102 /DNA_END=600 /DNA_ORIENTATION=-